MTTEELVGRLASDAAPIRRRSVHSVVLPPLAIGSLLTLTATGLLMGMKPFLQAMNATMPLLARGSVGLCSAAAGLAALATSLRPVADASLPRRLLSGMLLVLAGLVALQVLATSTEPPATLLLGDGLDRSPFPVVLLAVPVFISLTLGIRAEAPTHLDVTGASLGMTSGGVAALAYALVSPQHSGALQISWSSIGVCLSALAGLAIGPRLLRW